MRPESLEELIEQLEDISCHRNNYKESSSITINTIEICNRIINKDNKESSPHTISPTETCHRNNYKANKGSSANTINTADICNHIIDKDNKESSSHTTTAAETCHGNNYKANKGSSANTVNTAEICNHIIDKDNKESSSHTTTAAETCHGNNYKANKGSSANTVNTAEICNHIIDKDNKESSSHTTTAAETCHRNNYKPKKESSSNIIANAETLKKSTHSRNRIASSTNIQEIWVLTQQQSVTVDKPISNKMATETIMGLKDSTKILLSLIEDIQIKTKMQSKPLPLDASSLLKGLTPHLEGILQTRSLTELKKYVEEVDEDDFKHNCSIYQKLTRKCNCLNRHEFNDLIIQFNDNVKFKYNNLGEMIKNMRILKKFIYMGGQYSMNALIFLEEGLSKSTHSEKLEIVVACSHADLCNVFDDNSFVKICIRIPSKREDSGYSTTAQTLAAKVLYKISIVEEGRRYLTFNSNVKNDIRKTLKMTSKLDIETFHFLNMTLKSLNPLTEPVVQSTYYYKADKDVTLRTLCNLHKNRKYMTLEEIIRHLDTLHKMSLFEKGVRDLKDNFEMLCNIFKDILLQYDDGQMNVVMTSIINKILQKTDPTTDTNNDIETEPKSYRVSQTLTEPTSVKDKGYQVPESTLVKLRRTIKQKLSHRISVAEKDTVASRNKTRERVNESNKSIPFKFGRTITP